MPNKRAVLSQGELRNAAVNFDTYRILQQHHAVSLPQHGFFEGMTSLQGAAKKVIPCGIFQIFKQPLRFF